MIEDAKKVPLNSSLELLHVFLQQHLKAAELSLDHEEIKELA